MGEVFDFFILNDEGKIESIGRFADFDEADNHMIDIGQNAVWIFSEKAFADLKESIKIVEEEM